MRPHWTRPLDLTGRSQAVQKTGEASCSTQPKGQWRQKAPHTSHNTSGATTQQRSRESTPASTSTPAANGGPRLRGGLPPEHHGQHNRLGGLAEGATAQGPRTYSGNTKQSVVSHSGTQETSGQPTKGRPAVVKWWVAKPTPVAEQVVTRDQASVPLSDLARPHCGQAGCQVGCQALCCPKGNLTQGKASASAHSPRSPTHTEPLVLVPYKQDSTQGSNRKRLRYEQSHVLISISVETHSQSHMSINCRHWIRFFASTHKND